MTGNKEKNYKQQFQTEVFSKEKLLFAKEDSTNTTTQIFFDLI